MLVVVALGGNALLLRGEKPSLENQRRRIREAAAAIAEIAQEHAVVVTHGNGPQVGLLALQAESYGDVAPYPLDVLGAETEGLIGYLLEQELRAMLPSHDTATLLTQVEVDPADPELARPRKPIGPVYPDDVARELAKRKDWVLRAESSGGVRRVVASPEPIRILEVRSIRLLIAGDVLVVCAGGGGIPVAKSADGSWHGVDGVIDKDLTSSLLATSLGADALLLLTDQPAVFADWPTPARRPLTSAGTNELRALGLDAGSMGPKVEGACRFVETTGGYAGIGELCDAARILEGRSGTTVVAEASSPNQCMESG